MSSGGAYLEGYVERDLEVIPGSAKKITNIIT